jgi:hypothetical protein
MHLGYAGIMQTECLAFMHQVSSLLFYDFFFNEHNYDLPFLLDAILNLQ